MPQTQIGVPVQAATLLAAASSLRAPNGSASTLRMNRPPGSVRPMSQTGCGRPPTDNSAWSASTMSTESTAIPERSAGICLVDDFITSRAGLPAMVSE